ncbi:MAG: hypothetical protein HQ561_04555 [Desulfobacteraceae bacterium]|nr:hypothetical protein [Desulfobacteraceae bacterium]
MDEKTCLPFTRICFKNRFRYLFVSLLAMLVIGPFVEGFAYLQILFSVFLTAIFISAIYAISQERRHTLIASFLALPALGFTWATYFTQSIAFSLVSSFLGAVFFIFIAINILAFISQQGHVTTDMIIGAAVVYLLIAMTWLTAYEIIETLHPGSFAMPEGQLQDSRYLFLYYSLVTITTLGYGDVTPLTSVASSFSALEAVVGQLYLVITVAWLVGVHVSQSKNRKSPENTSTP